MKIYCVIDPNHVLIIDPHWFPCNLINSIHRLVCDFLFSSDYSLIPWFISWFNTSSEEATLATMDTKLSFKENRSISNQIYVRVYVTDPVSHLLPPCELKKDCTRFMKYRITYRMHMKTSRNLKIKLKRWSWRRDPRDKYGWGFTTSKKRSERETSLLWN